MARLPQIDNIALMIRRHFNVNLSLGDANGICAELGASQAVDRPLCEAFKLRSDSQSCEQSYRNCFAHLEAATGEPKTFTCHAGFSMILAPIVVQGHCVGAVIASGFTFDDAAGSEQTLIDRAKELRLAPSLFSSNKVDVNALSPRDRLILSDLIVEIALRAKEFLGDRRDMGMSVSQDKQGNKDYSQIIGRSEAMRALFATLDKVCDSESSVLIEGPAGVGKELVARAIHFNGPRAKGPFVIQNCSALNDALLDSELFGHKRGAFTGAFTDKVGLFEVAHQGTFFLDEIGDMSPQLQVKILRVLQEGSFVPVGGTTTRRVDVRIIAATNRDLDQMVADGSFRQDLYYRINVIKLKVSALADRRDDIPPLIEHFLARKSAENRADILELAPEVRDALCAYDWPGNVRELENEIERLVVLAGNNSRIELQDLSMRIRQAQALSVDTAPPITYVEKQPNVANTPPLERGDNNALETLPKPVIGLGENMNLKETMESLERDIIAQTLAQNEQNRSKTAEVLGISRRNLLRKIDRFGLN